MTITVVNNITVNLIRADDQVMFQANFSQSGQLSRRKNPSRRILRIAKKQHLCSRIDFFLKIIEIDFVDILILVEDQRIQDTSQIVVYGSLKKRRVGRDLKDNIISGFTNSSFGKVKSGYNTRNK